MKSSTQQLIFIGILVVFFSVGFINKNPRIFMAEAQVVPQVVQTVIPTITPTPTRQIIANVVIANAATATALAPLVPTPYPTPTLIPDSFVPGGEYEKVSSIWLSRGFSVFFICMLVWLVKIFRDIKIYQINATTEIKLAEITALQRIKIDPRPITSVTLSGDGHRIKLHNGETVDKKKIIEFVNESLGEDNQCGLSISKWKSKDGWNQSDIENILDHLASSNLVTERQSGKSCEWISEPSRRVLSHIFRLSIGEVDLELE